MKVRGAIADESLLHRQLLGVSVIALRKLDTLLSQTRVFDFNTCTQLHTQHTHTHTLKKTYTHGPFAMFAREELLLQVHN